MRFILIPFFGLFLLSSGTTQNTVGTLTYIEGEAFEGYNLIYPHNQPNVYLLNNCGDIIQVWEDESDFRPGNTAYLLDNGNLVKAKRPNASISDPIWAGGGGATVEIRSWDNEILQSFTLNDATDRLHHDIAITKDNTVLMIAWELKTSEEALQAGRDPILLPNEVLWPDYILEWDPDSDQIIWEWHVWDHLIQDFDPSKDNFGNVELHPELIDLNYDEHDGHQDWLHSNSIDYNPVLDQIVLSVPYFNELWIIDHSTTVEEAASHSGGNGGRGGDLLWRWGNPQTYRRESASQKLFFQHDAKWVDKDALPDDPEFGLISVFNNRANPSFSSLNTVSTQLDMATMNYPMNENVFLPTNFTLDKVHPDTVEIAMSTGLSSVQLLPNGNILSLSGRWGYAFELNAQDKIVWEYRIPLTAGQPIIQGSELTINQNITFRLDRYDPDFSGFEGRDLSPGPRIELAPNDLFCEVISSTQELNATNGITILENPVINNLQISTSDNLEVRLMNLNGLVLSKHSLEQGENNIEIYGLSAGVYFIHTDNGQILKFVKANDR